MAAPLFHTDCPSCGAPVRSMSASAVTLVCSYCHSLLVREGETLTDSGEDSALLEDFSPLQIGTSGVFNKQPFTLVGRLQARYDAGVWNEWYLLFADGSDGWLAEAGDQYVLTRPVAAAETPPAFASLRAGSSRFTFHGKAFIAADVRDITLERAAAEGELPFRFSGTRQNRVADFRYGGEFLTVDYADEPPEIFAGQGVALADLKLQNTRSDTQIIETAGKLKGSRASGNCPHCGSPVEWINGLTGTILCPSCGSDLASNDKGLALRQKSARRAASEAHTLPLGAEATIHNVRYTLIGVVHKTETGEDSGWTEYLLYAPQEGFAWLTETDDGEWSFAQTLNEWPLLDRGGNPLDKRKLYDYQSRVESAAGAFYWHIQPGDTLQHRDYGREDDKLCAEQGASELSWSRNLAVSTDQVGQWFGRKIDDGAAAGKGSVFAVMVVISVIFTIPAWLTMDSDDFGISLFITLAAIVGLTRLGKRGDWHDILKDDDDD